MQSVQVATVPLGCVRRDTVAVSGEYFGLVEDAEVNEFLGMLAGSATGDVGLFGDVAVGNPR